MRLSVKLLAVISTVILLSCSDETAVAPSTDYSGRSPQSLLPIVSAASQTGTSVSEEFTASGPWTTESSNGIYFYSSNLDIAQSGMIEDVNVVLNIDGFLSGPVVSLIRLSDNKEVFLTTAPFVLGSNFTGTTLDDEAALPLLAGSAPYTGSYMPVAGQTLAEFDSTDMSGRWILQVYNRNQLGLRNWKLVIQYSVTSSPPTANAGADLNVECQGEVTPVQLNGSGSSAPNGTITSYVWTEGSSVIGNGATPTVNLTTGTHTIQLTVTDNDGETATDEVVVTISDSTPPSVELPTSTTTLWPPNNKMIQVISGASATDACGVHTFSVTVTSSDNDPEDWSIVQQADGTYDVFVRAERAGNGGDRSYTISGTAADGSDNTTTASVVVIVPHDRGK